MDQGAASSSSNAAANMPIPLLRFSRERGDATVQPQQSIRRLEEDLEVTNFCAIIGQARAGKSFLLDYIMGENDPRSGFVVTAGKPQTRGMDMSSKSFTLDELAAIHGLPKIRSLSLQDQEVPPRVRFVDTEGIGGNHSKMADAQLLAITLLTSRVVILNWQGQLRENDCFDLLNNLATFADVIKLQKREHEHLFGELFIACRDYQSSIDKASFESWFKEMEDPLDGGDDEETTAIFRRNKVRAAFRKVHVHFLPYPVYNTEKLKGKDRLDFGDLSDPFTIAARGLVAKLLPPLSESTCFPGSDRKPMTGQSLATILRYFSDQAGKKDNLRLIDFETAIARSELALLLEQACQSFDNQLLYRGICNTEMTFGNGIPSGAHIETRVLVPRPQDELIAELSGLKAFIAQKFESSIESVAAAKEVKVASQKRLRNRLEDKCAPLLAENNAQMQTMNMKILEALSELKTGLEPVLMLAFPDLPVADSAIDALVESEVEGRMKSFQEKLKSVTLTEDNNSKAKQAEKDFRDRAEQCGAFFKARSKKAADDRKILESKLDELKQQNAATGRRIQESQQQIESLREEVRRAREDAEKARKSRPFSRMGGTDSFGMIMIISGGLGGMMPMNVGGFSGFGGFPRFGRFGGGLGGSLIGRPALLRIHN